MDGKKITVTWIIINYHVLPVYHLRAPRVPLVVSVPLSENHCCTPLPKILQVHSLQLNVFLCYNYSKFSRMWLISVMELRWVKLLFAFKNCFQKYCLLYKKEQHAWLTLSWFRSWRVLGVTACFVYIHYFSAKLVIHMSLWLELGLELILGYTNSYGCY